MRKMAVCSVLFIAMVNCAAGFAQKGIVKGRSKHIEKTERSQEVWAWPFKQNAKEVGVEYQERVVWIEDAKEREWKAEVPTKMGGTTTTDLEGHIIGRTPEYIGSVSQIAKGKLLAVSEKRVLLTIAGRKEEFWQSKNSLRSEDRTYVEDLETKLAKDMGELSKDNTKDKAKEKTADSKLRTWTSKQGEQVEGEFVRLVGVKVQLKLSDGTIKLVPFALLSTEDQQFIRQQKKPK